MVRKHLYREVYEAVHPLYAETAGTGPVATGTKDRFVRLFRRELEGKSILDVGCGQGRFLDGVRRLLRHKALVGIDTSARVLPEDTDEIRFIRDDIVDFDLGERFDVVFSDNVLEHIAPADAAAHLASVRRALKAGGTFIVLAPSRLFGPCDVTRMIDYTYTGRVAARGTHLMETTYGELVAMLATHGFSDFQTVLPIPKLKFLIPPFRMRPALLCFVERHRPLLSFFRGLSLNGQCVYRLDVTLIARAR